MPGRQALPAVLVAQSPASLHPQPPLTQATPSELAVQFEQGPPRLPQVEGELPVLQVGGVEEVSQHPPLQVVTQVEPQAPFTHASCCGQSESMEQPHRPSTQAVPFDPGAVQSWQFIPVSPQAVFRSPCAHRFVVGSQHPEGQSDPLLQPHCPLTQPWPLPLAF